jgi:hypothetical protein
MVGVLSSFVRRNKKCGQLGIVIQPFKSDLLLPCNFIDSKIYFVAHLQHYIGSSVIWV